MKNNLLQKYRLFARGLFQRELRHGRSWWFSWILLSGIICRLLIFISIYPQDVPDTVGYEQLAYAIGDLDFSNDEGVRTPGYPSFILLLGFNRTILYVIQLCLGLLSVSVLFWLTWSITHHGLISFLAGASVGINLWQMRFESWIVPETLVTFISVISVFILVGLLLWIKRYHRISLIILGLLCASAALTKPLFLLLPIVILISLLFIKHYRLKIFYFILPAFIPIFAWSYFNQNRFGYFGLTTLTGFSLTNHSGAFIEFAPEKYKDIRDLYLERRNARGGEHEMTIFGIIDVLKERTGKSYAELSEICKEMSMTLFLQHPFLYLKSVFHSWIKFVDARGQRTWDGARGSFISFIIANIFWRLQWYLLILTNVAFFFALPKIFKPFIKMKWTNIDLFLLSISVVILLAQIVQALIESGDNTRYGVPFQPLIVLVVLVNYYRNKKESFCH